MTLFNSLQLASSCLVSGDLGWSLRDCPWTAIPGYLATNDAGNGGFACL